MSIGCRIRPSMIRPSAELLKRFSAYPVANIDDAINRMSAMSHRLHPMNRSPRLCGPAYTVKVPEGDNLMLHKAMDLAAPGDVLVVDAGGDPHRAVFGDLIVTYCRKRGIAGIVVDGAIRDLETIGALTDFPVYATGVCPNGPWKNGPGEIGFPITCGGVIVRPGDIIVGDIDGVLAVPLAEAEAVAAATDRILANEEKIVAEITQKGTYTRPWVETKLAALGCEIVA